MHCAFRLAGAARGIKHEAWRICVERPQLRGLRLLQQSIELVRRDDDPRCTRRFYILQMLAACNDELGGAVLEYVGNAFRLKERAARHGDCPEPHDGEKS